MGRRLGRAWRYGARAGTQPTAHRGVHHQQSGQRLPWVLMLGASVLFSVFPLVVDFNVGPSDSPWLFQIGLSTGRVAGAVGFVALFCPQLYERKRLQWIARRMFIWSVLWKPDDGTLERRRQRRSVRLLLVVSAAQMNLAVFAWSTRFVDTAVTTIVYSVWPVLFVAAMASQYSPTKKHGGRYGRLTVGNTGAMLVAFAGVALVTWGAVGAPNMGGGWSLTIGVVSALVAAGGRWRETLMPQVTALR